MIDTNENVNYELRIHKNLRNRDYIRFGFFGIPDDFILGVKLRFNLNISLFFHDIALTNTNSLERNNISSLDKYLVFTNNVHSLLVRIDNKKVAD